MQGKSKKTRDKVHFIETSRSQEAILLIVAVALLGFFIYQFIVIARSVPLLIASVICITFSVHLLFSVGRRLYSKIYLAIVMLISLVPLSIVALLVRGYIKDLLGDTCMAFGGNMSCVSVEGVSIWGIFFYTAIPLAVLCVVAMIIQIRGARRVTGV